MTVLAGFDIGGTKCSVSIATVSGEQPKILNKIKYPTPPSPDEALERAIASLHQLIKEEKVDRIEAIGISCGGPLDSKRGLILSPPNLPAWDGIDVIRPFREFGVPVGLQNDANACALAEWTWGAGRGCDNMIFLTFGTGMGAGLILNGQLYAGENDMAGEVGHIRLEEDGPVGYGKAGSFEGFCSGGGIARLARQMAEERIRAGNPPSFCRHLDELPHVTAETVGRSARNGDPLALEIYRIVGEKLGKGLAVLVDILNPERIVIGSIYGRQQELLKPIVMDVLQKEALPHNLSVCQIVPAGLGESVGDLASLSVAMQMCKQIHR
ncbi:ROK family protein [Lihuaxuella thermophila]|uniref:Glucokinase n=1 Tax=Lihuaxuella thermophila TaxID=1173111 RepID=A0A1H8G930_9BACL|nr:ROK family protein [Lihuaxuella thermophila]SEN40546.1 glucokinase [Lihuaxuella thermophila]